MREEQLTDNGIDKLIGGVNNIMVQTLSVITKERNNQKFYGCQLSDGYCKLKGCLVVDEEIFTEGKLMEEHLVIKVIRFMVQQNKAQQPIIIIQDYKVFTDKVKNQIGAPIYYDQFMKKGKKNPEGNNVFEIPKVDKKPVQRSKYQHLMEDSKTQEDSHSNNLLAAKRNTTKPPQKNKFEQKKVEQNQSKQISSNSNSNNFNKGLHFNNEEENQTKSNTSNTVRLNNLNVGAKNNQHSNQTSNNSLKSKGQSPPRNKNMLPKAQNKGRTGPIQPMKNSPAIRGNQKKPNNDYNEIKSLFAGMDNFVILARVLFVCPIKTFINKKKGVQSSVLNIQLGDRTGTIECSMFGEVAQKFEGKFKEDQVYQIASASVGQSTYMGRHELKLTISETTRVSLKDDDDANVPFSEDFCLSIKQLRQAPVGQIVRVICLIKDNAQASNMTSRAGKQFRKKEVLFCDPEEKVEVNVTVWNDQCQETFQRQPYMIKGVLVNEYQGNRQYSLRSNFMARILKHHNLRRYIKDMDSISCLNLNSDKKKRGLITNLKELNNLMDVVDDKGTWSEIVCSLGTIKASAKNYYISCPHCKKKVADQSTGQCQYCKKEYDIPRPRYILQLSLCDSYDSVWVTAYDQSAEKILGMSAPVYAKLKQEELQELIKALRHQQFKMRLVTKTEKFKDQSRKKTNIIKILDLNYAEEARSLLSKLQNDLKS